jgi:hypothetical protein
MGLHGGEENLDAIRSAKKTKRNESISDCEFRISDCGLRIWNWARFGLVRYDVCMDVPYDP